MSSGSYTGNGTSQNVSTIVRSSMVLVKNTSAGADPVLYDVVRGGTPWRMLPTDFANWTNVYACFRRWVRDGHAITRPGAPAA